MNFCVIVSNLVCVYVLFSCIGYLWCVAIAKYFFVVFSISSVNAVLCVGVCVVLSHSYNCSFSLYSLVWFNNANSLSVFGLLSLSTIIACRFCCCNILWRFFFFLFCFVLFCFCVMCCLCFCEIYCFVVVLVVCLCFGRILSRW